MQDPQALPAGQRLVRTTPTFDEHTIPAALLAAHRTAPDVWGRLVIAEGSTGFVFDDTPGRPLQLHADDTVAIAPQRSHRIVPHGHVRLSVEFYRAADDLIDAGDIEPTTECWPAC